MRFLGIGDTCDLGSLYLRLIEGGHAVKIYIEEPLTQGTLAGMAERTTDWRQELDWLRDAGDDGIILFENVAGSRGELQDKLRRDGLNVIGGSAYGDRLENDRAYAQGVLADIGLSTCRVQEFDSVPDADAFLDEFPGRYVLKFNGPTFSSSDNYVGRLADSQDVRAVIAAKAAKLEGTSGSFILMEHVQGIEMGVGAYFNGRDFIGNACLDWEHKRFFTGDLGELTGEMGTVVTYDRTRSFFERTLARMTPLLRDGAYCGYINLNTIVNADGIWPLEFTCRFGYPGFAVLDPLQETPWADLFSMMITRSGTMKTRTGFCTGIVLTTPPFPYNRKYVSESVGLPVLLEGEVTAEDRRHLHYGEVGMDNGRLVTSGCYGWTMVVTGVGGSIAAAKDNACTLADRVVTPNVRYRRDIGAKLIGGDFAQVERWGYLDPV